MPSKRRHTHKPPKIFRPLLWSLRWSDIDVNEDKDDIIVNTINEGTLAHWAWIKRTYGPDTIRRVLKRRLATEFHPESLKLARVVFGASPSPYAR